MIELMLTHLPQTYLFIQITSIEYIDNVLKNLSDQVRTSFIDRVFIVTKSADKWNAIKIKKSIRECFPGLVEAKQFKALGAT